MTRTIKPFVPQEQEWMIIDNALFDHIMPSLTPNAWKVLCFILRKTEGWHKEWDGLSYTQIMKGTSIKSSATVSKAIKELLDQNYIKRVQTAEKWDSNLYALNLALEIEVDNGSTLENEVDANLEIKVGSTLDSKDTKEQHENTRKEQNTPSDFNIGETDPLDGVPQATDAHQRAVDEASGGNGADPNQQVAKHLYWGFERGLSELPPDKVWKKWYQGGKRLRERLPAAIEVQSIARYIDAWFANKDSPEVFWQDNPLHDTALDVIARFIKNGGKHAPNNRTGRVPGSVPKYSVADPAAFGEQPPDDA